MIGDRRGESGVLNNLGIILMRQGDYARSIAHLEQALHIYQDIGDRNGESLALSSLGSTIQRQGDHAKAATYREQALRGFRETGDRNHEAVELGNLSLTLTKQNKCAEAMAYCQQAIEISREVGNLYVVASNLQRLGELARAIGSYTEAKAYLEQTLQLAQQINAPLRKIWALAYLGCVFGDQGDYAKARAYLEKAIHLHQQVDDPRPEYYLRSYLGLVCHQEGENELARQHALWTAEKAAEIGHCHAEALAQTCLGYAYVGLGRLAEATDAYQRALGLYRKMERHHQATESLAGLARVSQVQGNLAQAQARVEEILAHLETGSLDDTVEPFRIYLTCYRVLEASADPRAQGILTTAHAELQERAAKITDEELRHSFLENVPANREIVAAMADSTN